MKETIQRIYKFETVIGQSGKTHKLHSAIDYNEGEFILNIIKDNPDIVKTLEVGCAYGLSSLFICLGIRRREGASHTIIDPFQKTSWDGVGIRYLQEAGIDFFRLIETKSEFALPRLLEDKEGPFDLIFIDGWHTFDHTLLDCFYATRLLRPGGVLVIDDVPFPSVKRVVEFLKNYPCYQEYCTVGDKWPMPLYNMLKRALHSQVNCKMIAKFFSPKSYRKMCEKEVVSMIALKKINEDNRNWDWHVDDF